MRYTGNANNLLWYLFTPFLFIFYISFIFWSNQNYVNKPVYEAVKNKQLAINSLESIDGVILGGSNAWWGISAKSLNKLTDLTWANLTISAEGYSDINYANFIASSLSDVKKQDISFVVYSSGTLVSKNNFQKRKNNLTNLVGKNNISYKPQRSLAAYIKNFMNLTKYRPYPLENEYGDFGFSDYPCGPFNQMSMKPRDYLSEGDLRIWTSEQLTQISELFPNAKIVIVVPNGFNKNRKDPNNDARGNLIKELKNILLMREESGKRSVYLISEKPFPSSDLMCSDDWHANEDGREWRTNELYQSIKDQLLNK